MPTIAMRSSSASAERTGASISLPRTFAPRVSSVQSAVREDLAGMVPLPYPHALRLRRCFSKRRLTASSPSAWVLVLEIKSEFAELAPSDRVEID